MKEVFTKQQLNHIIEEADRLHKQFVEEIEVLSKRIEIERANRSWAVAQLAKLESDSN